MTCPDDGADDRPRDPGAGDAAEQALQERVRHDERDEQQEYRLEIDCMMNAVDGHSGPRRRQAFSLDELHQGVGSRRNAAVEVVRLEVRRDDFGYHSLRDAVRDRAFETAADFDAKLPVVLGDDEDDTVVDARSADLPGVCEADGVLLDRLRLSRRQHQHRDLAALAALEIAQLGIQRLYLGSGQRAGEIGDARFERRHRDLGSERKAHQQDGDEAEPAFEHQRDYCLAGAPGLPKSTVGGFEIAFSSSTLKLGLTW